jgi:Zn-finger protein
MENSFILYMMSKKERGHSYANLYLLFLFRNDIRVNSGIVVANCTDCKYLHRNYFIGILLLSESVELILFIAE